MAAKPYRYITFLSVSLLTIASFVYYLSYPWIEATSLVEFWVLIGVLPYSVYMFFYEFKSERREDLSQGLVNEDRNLFMIDTYCKFLFPFIFAMFFSSLVNSLMLNMANLDGKSLLYFLISLFICIALPILCVADMYTTVRSRNPSPGKDIIILLIISLGLCVYRILSALIYYGSLKVFLPIIGQYLILALVVVNGYILYDYINHRRTGGAYYIMFSKVDNVGSSNIKSENEQDIRDQ
jgi:hypothetical protein